MMTNHDEHDEAHPQHKTLFMSRFLFNSLTNPPVRRERSDLAARAEQQRQQVDLAAVQQHRAHALAAQRC